MSEELLQRFLSSIDQEDGISTKTKKRRSKSAIVRDNVQTILRAASKGQVELSPEESYIVHKPSTSGTSNYIDDRLASQGFSLIDQARCHKPKDLQKRNLKYMKYQESRRLDPKKGRILVQEHLKNKKDLKSLRKEKKKVIGVKEPRRSMGGKKKSKSRKSGSIFSNADFDAISKAPKRVHSLSSDSFL